MYIIQVTSYQLVSSDIAFRKVDQIGTVSLPFYPGYFYAALKSNKIEEVSVPYLNSSSKQNVSGW